MAPPEGVDCDLRRYDVPDLIARGRDSSSQRDDHARGDADGGDHGGLAGEEPGAHRAERGAAHRLEPSVDDRAQADAIMAKLPFDPLYTRLDLVRVEGRLAVMELELIEPVLYFSFAPEGAGKLATATLARLGA